MNKLVMTLTNRRFRLFRNMSAAVCLLVGLTTSPSFAQAQSGKGPDDWKFTVAPYLMIPWMDGDLAVRGREVKVDVAPSEVFSNLQFGAMGYFEARKSKWGAGVDAVYMALGTTVDRDPLLGDRAGADVDLNQGAYSFMALRELSENVDFLAGVRWNVLDARLGLKGPQQSVVEQTKQWVDPIVGLKFKHRLGRRLNFSMQADIGGFGAGSDFAWQLLPMVGADLGKHTTLGIGYRVLGTNYKTGSDSDYFKYDVITQAFVLGAAFHF